MAPSLRKASIVTALAACLAANSIAETTSSATSTAPPAIAANPDYALVASKLDANGVLYVYCNLEDALNSAVNYLEEAISAAEPMAGMVVGSMGRKIVSSSGLGDLDDFGFSIAKLDNGMSRSKSYLKLHGKSGIFALCDISPRKLESLTFLPKDLAIAAASASSADKFIPAIEKFASDVWGDPGKDTVKKWLDEFRKNAGFDAAELLSSLGDEASIGLRVDLDKKITIGSDEGFRIPKPSLLAAVKVKDSTLLEVVKAQCEKMKISLAEGPEIEGAKTFRITVRDTKYCSPAIATTDKWFVLASEESLLKDAFAAAKSGEDFRSTPEYRAVAAGLPEEVTGIQYIGPKWSQALAVFANDATKNENLKSASWLWRGISKHKSERGVAAVWISEAEGIHCIAQGDFSPGEAAYKAVGVVPMAIVAAVAVPNFLEAQVRAKVSRVKSDQRSLATALESYYVDYNAYPPSSDKPDGPAFKPQPGKIPAASFATNALTTPVGYLTSNFLDAFGDTNRKDTFGYYMVPPSKDNDETAGWIVLSPGPDRKFDLDWRLYDGSKKQPSPQLLDHTYDPTNGTVSSGDIWRIKQ